MIKPTIYFLIISVICTMIGCGGRDGIEMFTIKRQKVANGEIVLLTDTGMQDTMLEIYYTDSLGVNHWVTSGGDVYVDEKESLVSVCKNKSSSEIIFRYRSNIDRIYDIPTNHLIEKAHDDAADYIVLFNLKQLQDHGNEISKAEAARYRQALNLEMRRNRLQARSIAASPTATTTTASQPPAAAASGSVLPAIRSHKRSLENDDE